MSGVSRYLFAAACVHAASCARWYGINSFLGFLQYVDNHGNFDQDPPNRGKSPWEPQSFIHREQCGQPCKYDFMLHTETMQEDWIKLMDKMGEPRTLLPHDVNPSGKGQTFEFTPEVLEIIHRIDANMFEEFGFKKRTSTFQLQVESHMYGHRQRATPPKRLRGSQGA